IERDLADVGDAVAPDLQVRGGIAAHGRERALPDAIAAHDHVGGAKHVDGVAVLARAAGAVGDVLDAVVDDQRTVVAARRAPDLNAVVAGAIDPVARDHEAARIERMDGDVGRIRERGVDHLAVGGGADEAVAAGAPDLAVGYLDAAAIFQLHETAPFGQR